MRFFAKNKKPSGWTGITFHDEGIRVAHIKRIGAGKPVVEGAVFYPAGAISREAALEKLAKDWISINSCHSSLLNAGEYQLLSVDAPNVPREELKTAIRWRLKDMLDFHIDDATIDVLDVPMEKNAPSRAHSMYAVAARNQIIRHRQELFEENKFPLNAIDIPELAQRNISALVESDGRAQAMLSFDSEGGLLTITHEGELYLARRIDASLQQIVDGSEEEKNAIYERINLELQRSFDHFDRQCRHLTLARLVLFPMREDAFGLQAYLTPNLYVPIENLDLQTVLDLSKVPELKRIESQQAFFFTLGAALRQEEIVL